MKIIMLMIVSMSNNTGLPKLIDLEKIIYFDSVELVLDYIKKYKIKICTSFTEYFNSSFDHIRCLLFTSNNKHLICFGSEVEIEGK